MLHELHARLLSLVPVLSQEISETMNKVVINTQSELTDNDKQMRKRKICAPTL